MRYRSRYVFGILHRNAFVFLLNISISCSFDRSAQLFVINFDVRPKTLLLNDADCMVNRPYKVRAGDVLKLVNSLNSFTFVIRMKEEDVRA